MIHSTTAPGANLLFGARRKREWDNRRHTSIHGEFALESVPRANFCDPGKTDTFEFDLTTKRLSRYEKFFKNLQKEWQDQMTFEYRTEKTWKSVTHRVKLHGTNAQLAEVQHEMTKYFLGDDRRRQINKMPVGGGRGYGQGGFF